MPITIHSNPVQAFDGNGKQASFDVITDRTTQERIDEINRAADDVIENISNKTEKARIDFDGTNFKLNGEVLNYKQIYDIHITTPDFGFVVYGDRAYLLSYVQDGEGMKEMRFQSTLAVTDTSGLSNVKTSGIYVTSTDGINIASVRITDINNENKGYKVSAITDANKTNEVMYPSVKAVVDHTNEIKQDLTRLQKKVGTLVFGNNINAINSSVYDKTYEIDDLKDKIAIGKEYGIHQIWIPVVVKPTMSECSRIDELEGNIKASALDNVSLSVLPSYTYIDELVSYAESIGVSVSGIKVHESWLDNNYLSFSNKEKFFAAYGSKVKEIANRYKKHITYFTFLNEAYEICHDAEAESHIISLSNQIRTYGLKTGLCGVYPTDAICDNVDILSVHRYPHISSKMENTVLEDCLTGWRLSGMFEKLNYYHTRFPQLEVHIVEAGVMNYWEALAEPERYLSNGRKSDNNEIQYMFFKALSILLKDYQFVRSVNCWFLDLSREYTMLYDLFGGEKR